MNGWMVSLPDTHDREDSDTSNLRHRRTRQSDTRRVQELRTIRPDGGLIPNLRGQEGTQPLTVG